MKKLIALIVLALVAGCGQKGALYFAPAAGKNSKPVVTAEEATLTNEAQRDETREDDL